MAAEIAKILKAAKKHGLDPLIIFSFARRCAFYLLAVSVGYNLYDLRYDCCGFICLRVQYFFFLHLVAGLLLSLHCFMGLDVFLFHLLHDFHSLSS